MLSIWGIFSAFEMIPGWFLDTSIKTVSKSVFMFTLDIQTNNLNFSALSLSSTFDSWVDMTK